METSVLSKSSRLALFVVMFGYMCPAWAADKKAAAPPPASLQVHPLVFSMIQGWLSDGDSPVATEINLDAVAASRNQFDPESVKEEDGWTRCTRPDGGFLRYRVVQSKGEQLTVEYQENGGGSLTLAATMECTVGKRTIKIDGQPKSIRVLRVLTYRSK